MKPSASHNISPDVRDQTTKYTSLIHFWKHILAGLLGISAASALLLHFFSSEQELIIFGLYSTLSHFLVSFFPHEPALLYYAKFYSPLLITLASTIGCGIAGMLDYWFLLPVFHHRSVRPKFERSRLYIKLTSLFERSAFWSLVIAGFSPIPFYPFKFMSIASGYPLWKYQAALVVGRGPRYFLLAWFGYVVQLPNWLLILSALLLIGFFGTKAILQAKTKHATKPGSPEAPEKVLF